MTLFLIPFSSSKKRKLYRESLRYRLKRLRYKIAESHEIKAAVLIPKDLKPGSHPVIFHVHGGFLTTAHSLFAPFFSPCAIELALQCSAVIVSPDYRLLPTANGVADVLEDLEDFWQWTRSNLPKVLELRAPGHLIDLSQALLVGGSAGGYGVVQLALSHPDDVRAVAMVYPLLDPKDDIFVKGPTVNEPNVLRFPWKDIPSKDAIITWLHDKRKTVQTKAGFERTPFSVGATQYGLFHSEVFDNRNLILSHFDPLERIKAGGSLPKKM